MSYCIGGDGDAWISPRGWGAVIGFRASEFASAAAPKPTPRPPSAKPRAVRDMHVTAVESSSDTMAITGVSPADSPPNPDPASGYTIEARDEGGNLLGSAIASSAVQLKDGGGTLIDGTITAPPGTTQVFAGATTPSEARGAWLPPPHQR